MASGKQLLFEIEQALLERGLSEPVVVLIVGRSPRGRTVTAQAADLDGRRIKFQEDDWAHGTDINDALRKVHRITVGGERPRRNPPPPRPATRGKKRGSLERVRRMQYEHTQREKPFDPETASARYPVRASAHHFAVNPDISEDLDEFYDDFVGVQDEAAMGELGGETSSLPFVRQKAGLLMQHWHSSQNDPVYAVGSFYFEGKQYPDTEIVSDAKERLENIVEFHADEYEGDDIRELQMLVEFLEWDLQTNYYGVNG